MIGLVVTYHDADPLGKEEKDRWSEWIDEEKEWCIEEQPGCAPSEKTMTEFWSKFPEILQDIRRRARDVRTVMAEFAQWYRELLDKYEVVAWACGPASYDWMWISVLYHKYAPAGSPELPYSARCVTSTKATCRLLGITLLSIKHKNLPHTHRAVEDAREQAYEYSRILRELERCKALALKNELVVAGFR